MSELRPGERRIELVPLAVRARIDDGVVNADESDPDRAHRPREVREEVDVCAEQHPRAQAELLEPLTAFELQRGPAPDALWDARMRIGDLPPRG